MNDPIARSWAGRVSFGEFLYRTGDRNFLNFGLDLSNPRQVGAWFCDETGNNNGTRLEVRYYTAN